MNKHLDLHIYDACLFYDYELFDYAYIIYFYENDKPFHCLKAILLDNLVEIIMRFFFFNFWKISGTIVFFTFLTLQICNNSIFVLVRQIW